MRQIVRCITTFIVTLIVVALLSYIGIDDEITPILMGALIVLIVCIGGDIACHAHRMTFSMADVMADTLGLGAAFIYLLLK